ncbi:sister chromatid cohesion protein PDS5 homolog A-B-like isoform X2 [Zootermopsis nevadensis]|uniref:sister chromatid cohesion protein PDS5 homolog A-B-like isoform X2 n=1 Tax=Zootermopsis nevadensis TaxID=136037 RepID=UPI000B8EAB96|nr:sister chromatid cohesion protein PDS5 homolog A-B-like isoform X2 [Zootermopsis nevadensis]
MFELHHICPTILLGIWNQLEVFMLEHSDSPNKKITLTLLAHMFSEVDSDFVIKYRRLWNNFKNCVNEPSSFGRSLIVKWAPKFLVNQPDLCEDIIHILQRRSCDNETTIRFGVVKAINKATKKNLDILHHSALLDILKDSFCDRSEIVLKEALITLGLLYGRITDGNSPGMMMKAIWIANTLMHLYIAPYDLNIYIPHIEKVIVKCLVPCNLPPDQRMWKLLQLWCLFDDESRTNFHHSQELKRRAYGTTLQLLSLYQQPPDDKLPYKQVEWHREMLAGKLSLTMGNQREAHHRLLLLVKELATNRKLFEFLQNYVNETNTCEDYERLWSENQDVLTYTSESKKRSLTLKRSVLTKESIILIVKSLCAKVACFLVDKGTIKELLKLVINCVTSSDIAEDLHLARTTVGKLAVELLYEYFYLMPHLAFQDDSTMDQLLFLLTVDSHKYSLPAMKIFITLSAYKPLGEVYPAIVSDHLVPVWHAFATFGTPAQAKLAIRCLCSHTVEPVITHILAEFTGLLDIHSKHYLTREVAVSHFARYLPNYTDTRCITYVTEMCHEVEALKALTRLTIRLRETPYTERTLTILSKIVENGGAYASTNNLSTATKAWLRLTAGCAFLKICDIPCIYAKQVQKTYFFRMALLMNDESESVRRLFVEKLRERLMQWEQQRYGLPSMFISYFVLAGTEEAEDVKSCVLDALNLCVQDKRQQVWSLVCVTRLFRNVSHLLTRCQQAVPEFCVQTAIQIVARYVFDFTDETSAHRAYTCLSFLLNSLLSSKNGKFGLLATDFYVKLFALMRSCKNAVTLDDEELNKKIWATCEIGEYLLSTVNPGVNNDAEAPVPILDETFQKIDPNIDNTEIKYLTRNMVKLLNMTVDSQLAGKFEDVELEAEGEECTSDDEEVAVFYPNKGEYEIQLQDRQRTESTHITSDDEASPRSRMQLQMSRIQNMAKKRRSSTK